MSAKTIKATNQRGVKQVSLFDKSNYMLMGIGLIMIIVGYLLMAGGKSEDPNVFNYDEIYSFRRITLAPIMVLGGFVVEIIAIMKRPKVVQE